jgi:hypothetical protein
MNKEFDREFILLQKKQTKMIIDIAKTIQETGINLCDSLDQYHTFADKNLAAINVNMHFTNYAGSIYHFEQMINMYNINSQPTWNSQGEIDEISIKFGTSETVSSNEHSESNTEESHGDEPHEDELHEHEPNTDEPNTDEPNTDEPNTDELNEDEAHEDEAHEDEALEDKTHEDEDEALEDEALEDKTHEDEDEALEDEDEALEDEDEALEDESIKDESIKDESIKDESIKDESIKDESIKDESIKDKSIVENDISEYTLSTKTSKRKTLESSSYFSRKYINPTEEDRNVFIIRDVNIEKLTEFHYRKYNSTKDFWNWCWDEEYSTFKWNLEEGTIFINSPSKKSLNNCLYELAVIFENI